MTNPVLSEHTDAMPLMLIKITAERHRGIIETRGRILAHLIQGLYSTRDFDHMTDVHAGLDYRDIAFHAEQENHPLSQLFLGEPLVAGYEWTYGPPSYFDPAATRAIHRPLASRDNSGHLHEIAEFLGRAVAEGKGIIVGVA